MVGGLVVDVGAHGGVLGLADSERAVGALPAEGKGWREGVVGDAADVHAVAAEHDYADLDGDTKVSGLCKSASGSLITSKLRTRTVRQPRSARRASRRTSAADVCGGILWLGVAGTVTLHNDP